MYKPTGFIALPMLGLLVVVAAGIAFASWWIAGREEAVAPTISNFAECAATGNAIMESYPRQCTANGQTFVEVIANTNAVVNGNVNTAVNSNTNATMNTNATVSGNINTASAGVTYDLMTAKKGDRVAGMIVESASYDGLFDSSIKFSGKATLTGYVYFYPANTVDGTKDAICLEGIEATAATVLPRVSGSEPLYKICFSNTEAAKAALYADSLTKSATVVIDEFSIVQEKTATGSDTTTSAKFISVTTLGSSS